MELIHSGPMASRTVLVTGGTGGIGRATALAILTIRVGPAPIEPGRRST
jgi:short-subunit dehydrogenase involved in D-alanine esterification of teichoic acids